MGVLAVLTLACANKSLSYSEFKESLDALVKAGFWITIDVYNKALEKAKEVSRESAQSGANGFTSRLWEARQDIGA